MSRVVSFMFLAAFAFLLGTQSRNPTIDVTIQVSGTVRDAETGKPLPRFSVYSGIGRPGDFNAHGEAVVGTNGAYETEVRHLDGLVRGQSMSMICVEAEGYLPESRQVPTMEDRATVDIALKRGANITGTVVGLEGKPLEGAHVVRCARYHALQIENGMIPRDAHIPSDVTNMQGEFVIQPGLGLCRLIVVHDDGFAFVREGEHDPTKPIAIQPWGRVEGTVMSGEEPVASAQVVLTASSLAASPTFGIYSSANADTDGHFAINRVAPGTASVGYRVEVNGVLSVTSTVAVTVEAGKTARIQVGGRGRQVIGQIDMTEEEKKLFVIQFGASLYDPIRHVASYTATVEDDGSFIFTDVRPGTYRFQAQFVRRTLPEEKRQQAFPVMIAGCDITVPEMTGRHSDEVLDIGSVTLKKTH